MGIIPAMGPPHATPVLTAVAHSFDDSFGLAAAPRQSQNSFDDSFGLAAAPVSTAPIPKPNHTSFDDSFGAGGGLAPTLTAAAPTQPTTRGTRSATVTSSDFGFVAPMAPAPAPMLPPLPMSDPFALPALGGNNAMPTTRQTRAATTVGTLSLFFFPCTPSN
jgi:hypothetical protein